MTRSTTPTFPGPSDYIGPDHQLPRRGAPREHEHSASNVGTLERAASVLLGGAALFGAAALARREAVTSSVMLGGLGVALTVHGLKRHSMIYDLLHVEGDDATMGSHPLNRHIHVDQAITIDAPRDDLYRFWRKLENLPQIMRHLKEVRDLGNGRSHWRATGPAHFPGGPDVEWEAQITEERENELIAWESIEGSQVENSGRVSFSDATGGRGTVIHVVLRYQPPGGALAAALARAFGEDAPQQISSDLRRLKQRQETGEEPTTQGQPRGNNC